MNDGDYLQEGQTADAVWTSALMCSNCGCPHDEHCQAHVIGCCPGCCPEEQEIAE